MPRTNSGRRNAAGTGSIRKKSVTRNGKTYIYWEARLTVGFDPGTGKQVQKSFTGKTQKEVRQQMQAAAAEVNKGTYREPSKITVGEWLDTWMAEYLGGVKPFTVVSYTTQIRKHIQPALGAVRLESLNTNQIQRFYNTLRAGTKDTPPLSPKTIKNIHGVLHKALQQAVAVGYLRFNPSEACILPRVVRKELSPLDDADMVALLHAIQGHPMETLFKVTLFTGMREGEVLGLKWDCVNFQKGTILINKQLQREKKKGGAYVFAPLKNDKARMITPASAIMGLLKRHREAQRRQRALIGEAWVESGLVFTNELGGHLATHTVYQNFKRVAASIGRPDARFHDLRHSYAVAAIRSGDDIKTVQGNLGHATAAFTLDVYGHVTDQMKRESAARMDAYLEKLQNPEKGKT